MNNKKLLTIVYALSTALVTSCSQEEKSTEAEQQNVEKTQPVEQSHSQSNQDKLIAQFDKATQTLFKNRAIAATLFGVSNDTAGYHYQSAMENYNPQSEAAFRKELKEASTALNSLSTDSNEAEENRKVVADIIDYFAGAERICRLDLSMPGWDIQRLLLIKLMVP